MRSARSFTSLTFTRHLQSPSVESPGERGEAGAALRTVGVLIEGGKAVGEATLGGQAIKEAGQRRAGQLARRADRTRRGHLGQRRVRGAHGAFAAGEADQLSGVVGQRLLA